MKSKITLGLSVLLMLTACNHSEKLPNGEEKLSTDIINNPASASGRKSAESPAFNFAEDRHHFGEVSEGEVVSYTFVFTNSGGSDLVIASATGSCGCTVPEYSKNPVAPGSKGEIKVTFDTNGKSGMVSKTITLVANTVPATKVLTVSAEIISKNKK